MVEIKATYKVLGALTRSTVGDEAPDPLEDVLHWIWSWQVQCVRLKESSALQFQEGTSLERRRASSRASFDEHMLVVTGWNVVRAIDSAQPVLPVTVARRTREALRLLRNLYEHWDEQRESFRSTTAKERSAAEFVQAFPEGKPYSISFTGNEWFLGGILAVGELTRQLEALEEEILKQPDVIRNERRHIKRLHL